MSVSGITVTSQHLTFKLGEEVYSVEVAKIREVLDLTPVTKVPRMPEFMLGVINLRGNVVPVVDMRLKLGMTNTENTVDTCIVIVEVAFEGDATVLGALVDAVQEVIDLEPDQIDPPPSIGTGLNTEFIRGMGKRDDQFIIILDIDKVFSVDELALVRETGDTSTEEAVAEA